MWPRPWHNGKSVALKSGHIWERYGLGLSPDIRDPLCSPLLSLGYVSITQKKKKQSYFFFFKFCNFFCKPDTNPFYMKLWVKLSLALKDEASGLVATYYTACPFLVNPSRDTKPKTKPNQPKEQRNTLAKIHILSFALEFYR